MTEAEIEETIEGFVQAARRCWESGFDGVEVWAAYHGIVDQFWTPWSNRRDDQWGGTLENRTRFSREIITRIRKLCGDDFIIGISVSDEPDFEVVLQRESWQNSSPSMTVINSSIMSVAEPEVILISTS